MGIVQPSLRDEIRARQSIPALKDRAKVMPPLRVEEWSLLTAARFLRAGLTMSTLPIPLRCVASLRGGGGRAPGPREVSLQFGKPDNS